MRTLRLGEDGSPARAVTYGCDDVLVGISPSILRFNDIDVRTVWKFFSDGVRGGILG